MFMLGIYFGFMRVPRAVVGVCGLWVMAIICPVWADNSEKIQTATASTALVSNRVNKPIIPSLKLKSPPPHSIAIAPPFIVTIDPGHGGYDPGAIGPGHIQEKDITLAIGKRLYAVLKERGIRPVMTRDDDSFVELRGRIDVARKSNSNLFVSIHANSVTNPSMSGTAAYVLSDHGEMTENARWLSRKENSADLVGGISLHKSTPDVAQVLLDISQTATLEASFAFAHSVLHHVGAINNLQKNDPQQAAFVVLKAPDIPSILVETDFVTNPERGKLLSSPAFQQKFAMAIAGGIIDYRDKYAPVGANRMYAQSNTLLSK